MTNTYEDMVTLWKPGKLDIKGQGLTLELQWGMQTSEIGSSHQYENTIMEFTSLRNYRLTLEALYTIQGGWEEIQLWTTFNSKAIFGENGDKNGY